MADMKHQYIEHAARNLVPEHLDHVLEFGVAKGTSIRIIRLELDRNNVRHDLFGFDSFIGLQEDWITPDGDVLLGKGSFSTNGNVPPVSDVVWFSGWFEDTIPEYLKIAKNIALLHVDCDLYAPARQVFYDLREFIVEGTIIAIDDWFYERNPKYNDTTQRAFYEWVKEFDINFRFCEFPGCDNPRLGQKIVEVLR